MEQDKQNVDTVNNYQPSSYLDVWDPYAYLRFFYSLESTESGRVNAFVTNTIKVLDQQAEKLKGKQRVLEFGGGATLWPSFLLAQYFEQIWFCDYTPSNLECVKDWLDKKPTAHDWKPYFNHLLDAKQGHHNNAEQYEAQLRSALLKGKIFRCDVHDKNLLLVDEADRGQKFDMIFTCGCFEAACSTYDMLNDTIHRLGDLLKPGGFILILTYRNATYYKFQNHIFTDLPINEGSMQRAFAETGLFTKPTFIFAEEKSDPAVEDSDGLLITYAYRKSI